MFASTGQGVLGYNMFAYCNNNPVMNSDPSGEDLLGAMIGGAIAGALISMISHRATNPDATVGSTLLAMGVGAVTGAIGGAAGVVSMGYRLLCSGAAGLIAGVYATCTTPGDWKQKLGAGVATCAIAATGTFLGAGIDTSGFDTFGTAVANYSTGILVGSIAESSTVVVQQHIIGATVETSMRPVRNPSQQRTWDAFRQKEDRLVFGNI